MDPYGTPQRWNTHILPEPNFSITEGRPSRLDVAASTSDRKLLLGASAFKFLTFAIMLGISIYLEVEEYNSVGPIAAAVNTIITVGGISSITAMIAAAQHGSTIHIASLTLATASVFFSIYELLWVNLIYTPGKDVYLAFLHIAPFDLSTGLVLLGVQGAIIANMRRQKSEQTRGFFHAQSHPQLARQTLPQYIRSS